MTPACPGVDVKLCVWGTSSNALSTAIGSHRGAQRHHLLGHLVPARSRPDGAAPGPSRSTQFVHGEVSLAVAQVGISADGIRVGTR